MSTHNKCFEQKNNNVTPEKPTLPISFSWLGPELLVCLAHRGSAGVFLLLRSY